MAMAQFLGGVRHNLPTFFLEVGCLEVYLKRGIMWAKWFASAAQWIAGNDGAPQWEERGLSA